MINTGTWKKGNKTIKGNWQYNRATQRFIICIVLDERHPITGLKTIDIETSGESPEWFGWELQE